MGSAMYKKLHFVSGTGLRKISSVACGFSPIKIHFLDYLCLFCCYRSQVNSNGHG